MDGSSFAPIIIPIVVMASLAAWLIILYYPTATRSGATGRPTRRDTQPAELARQEQPTHRRAA